MTEKSNSHRYMYLRNHFVFYSVYFYSSSIVFLRIFQYKKGKKKKKKNNVDICIFSGVWRTKKKYLKCKNGDDLFTQMSAVMIY